MVDRPFVVSREAAFVLPIVGSEDTANVGCFDSRSSVRLSSDVLLTLAGIGSFPHFFLDPGPQRAISSAAFLQDRIRWSQPPARLSGRFA